jgi:hypothetical protein
MIRRTFLAAVCLASAFAATPQLTTIQDVLYKADGTRFNGILTISWSGFQSIDSDTIITQSTTVKVAGGNLRVQLVPNPLTTPQSYYTVTYNSDGRVQFQETWLVPSSATPVRLRDVRTTPVAGSAGADTGGSSTGGPVPESDVVGLVADLAARPLEGSAFAAGRVAYINPLGAIDAVSGNASDCLHVDGSSAACGSSNTSFMDGDSPAGIVDGANTAFTLSATPNPASSLAVYRNGILQKAVQDYTANGNALTFVTAGAPQPGDTLLASYRLGGDASGTAQSFPSPQVLCSGTGSATTGVAMTSIGACSIPAGLLLAGDRVEIHFDLAHTGTTSGFTFEADWAATPILNRSGAIGDALVTVRADAGILAAGAQLSAQSWGTVLPFSAAVAPSTDAYASGITIDFQGKLAQAGDTLTLAGFTVVRIP